MPLDDVQHWNGAFDAFFTWRMQNHSHFIAPDGRTL
jgi:hypothetical protein